MKSRRMDHRRSDNYRYYTRRIWGRAQNYDLTVNTEIGTETVQNMIRELLEIKKRQAVRRKYAGTVCLFSV